MRATRLHRLLAGEDGPEKRALPAGEFLHPVPLLAVIVLMVNDHWLKGAGVVPAQITGKLSDFAGLLFFPLLVTSLSDVAAQALSGLLRTRWNFTLTRAKLVVACAATGALFTAIKLSARAADAVAGMLSAISFESAIVADPTDLVALPMLGVAYWLGTREIARVPLGRIQFVQRLYDLDRVPVADGLHDVEACGGDAGDVAALADGLESFFDGGEASAASEALARLRGRG